MSGRATGAEQDGPGVVDRATMEPGAERPVDKLTGWIIALIF